MSRGILTTVGAALFGLAVTAAGSANAQSTSGVERSGGSRSSPPPASSGDARSGGYRAVASTFADNPTINDIVKANESAAAAELQDIYESLEATTPSPPPAPADAGGLPDHGNGNP